MKKKTKLANSATLRYPRVLRVLGDSDENSRKMCVRIGNDNSETFGKTLTDLK